ncbi:BN860_10484g1_1 [Zygosaccharomyces bailii CLIB 213]|uniref:RNA helicase n=1 Tax=Zygosaccharomyces bailii (strain CLIB 213 / ATCC 58445 / CBS 680 / BCRC 21525 / NBRC 1098 / NCYC 1416 / NRRL Y-2227) TaxID=1333698 RepID=A0A8J2X6C0_ZYGB2|nr:BN860_10484g1_1 [Zygosaccharomyces bailii CLIB 213]
MGTYRKRFNEKARAGQIAKQNRLKRIRNKQFLRTIENRHDDKEETLSDDHENTPQHDSNASILPPVSKEEEDLKKRKLQELFAPKESKVSRIKRKRLDKFIDHQLRKEEKKALMNKLQDYKIDTSLLTSSKRLGHGKQTKKERFQEALTLEKQGRADANTKDILYEEHEQKNWFEDYPQNTENDRSEDEQVSEEEDIETKSSKFIDFRPVKGSGMGFGFANAKVVNRHKPSKKKYKWRQLVEMEEKKKHDVEDDNDFMSTGDEEDDSVSNVSEDTSVSEESATEISEDKVLEENNSSKNLSYDDDTDESVQENLSEDIEDSSNSPQNTAESFKQWANEQIRELEGRNFNLATPSLDYDYEPIVRQEDLEDGLEADEIPIDEKSKRKAFYVEVSRPERVQQVRMQLPVFGEEHRIMEAIHHNDVIIICGATGSGKTTQVPQFMYESGFGCPQSPDYPGMIGITQPRRVAAIAMAKRVSNELGNHGDKVAHQIRFDSTVQSNTRLKFMTDGVLLREMMQDFRLRDYSSIVIDEAHERNINTDILIGMLSRCVRLRAKEHARDPENNKKLKLVIMSATLRVADFSDNTTLFVSPPPIINVEARQFPVAIHFDRRTAFNYVEEAFRKTCKIHQRLPPGAILVFLTGQQEINHMVKKLRREFPFPRGNKNRKEMESPVSNVKVNSKNADMEAEDIDFSVKILENDNLSYIEEDEDQNNEGEEEAEEGFDETLEDGQNANDPLYVLPLYSLLSTKEQMKVFDQPPPGSRLCIVATNVAETSLTIPGVRYVVDCGRSKERTYDESNGVQSFEIGWISKASADQRSGRAGRTGPGHCYRLYSSAVFEEDFPQFSSPEILRMPVESVVLQMKSMAIQNVTNFPFPTPPDPRNLMTAITVLQHLGALDAKEKITEEGKVMNLFPLSPRYSKILLVSTEQKCLSYAISIVSTLSVGDPFLKEQEIKPSDGDYNSGEEEVNDEQKRLLLKNFHKSKVKFSKLDPHSDVFRLLSVVSAFDYVPRKQRAAFIRENFLRGKFLEEICKLRKQLTYIVKSNTSQENVAVKVSDDDLKSSLPTEIQLKMLKQMICAGFIDQVAIRADYLFPDDVQLTNKMSIVNIPYVSVLSPKSPDITSSFVYIHPSSVLASLGAAPPKFLVYHSLHSSSNSKTRMTSLCDIKSTPLANVARKGSLLTYSKPLTGKGLKTINLTHKERYCYVVPRFGDSTNSDLSISWDLNPVPVHEVKEKGQWVVTKFITNKSFEDQRKRSNH